MPRWLTMAAGRIRRSPAVRVEEPYEVTCVCGRKYRGLREELWQELECAQCRSDLFVLPLSAYPRPVEGQPELNGSDGGATEILHTLGRGGRRLAARVRSLPSGVVSLARPPLRRIRRQITRFRLIMAGAAIVVAATVWWGWSYHARQQAALTLVRAAERGEQALSAGDIPAAASAFRDAAVALDTLGRDDAQAESLRQLDRECHAATHLATASVYDMLHEADRALSNNAAAGWEEDFKFAYGGRWVVFDTTIQRQTHSGKSPRFHVEYPLTVGGSPVHIEAPLSAFDRLDWGAASWPVIFAARVRGARLDRTERNKRWVVSLDGESGFLWSHYETYQALGLGPDEFRTEQQIRALLAKQSSALGLDGRIVRAVKE